MLSAVITELPAFLQFLPVLIPLIFTEIICWAFFSFLTSDSTCGLAALALSRPAFVISRNYRNDIVIVNFKRFGYITKIIIISPANKRSAIS